MVARVEDLEAVAMEEADSEAAKVVSEEARAAVSEAAVSAAAAAVSPKVACCTRADPVDLAVFPDRAVLVRAVVPATVGSAPAL